MAASDVKHQLKIPRFISNGMVLQREAPVRLWGWAAVGCEVTVGFRNKSYTTNADMDGKWFVTLDEMDAGGPYDMEIEAGSRIIIKDILVGDVWVCAGQSNMVLPMSRVDELYEDDIRNSENPFIRLFTVPERVDFKKAHEDYESGAWKAANPENILDFTATGYFFAKTLYEQFRIPIGLINASVGGSPVEAWMSEDALKDFPVYMKTANDFKDDDYINKIKTEEEAVSSSWYSRAGSLDKGLANGDRAWHDADYDAVAWPVMQLPAYWEDEGLKNLNGVVWFRKEINVPASMAGKKAKLKMGRIVDSDEVYVNGVLVGTVSYQYPPRRYSIPENLLKEGRNSITVRVVNTMGKGGFIKDKPYKLIAEGGHTIDLRGEWHYQVGVAMEPLPGTTFLQYKPLGLYNGMLAPVVGYAIKGVAWYQGESNDKKPEEYEELFPALIADWRCKWRHEDFPFLYVQLPNYGPAAALPTESKWAILRQAQLKTLKVPNTGMAVAIDLGEWNDLHPLNKKDVGARLALAARKIAYGEEVPVYSGPIFKSMEIRGDTVILSFDNTGSGLIAKGRDELMHFAVSENNIDFIWAKAEIKGNQVIVRNENIKHPITVRYAWADNPESANLYNREGLPASPFQTVRQI